jgi:hypothetical protein
VPEAISYYAKVEGNKYCMPWTDAGGTAEGAESVEACEARCDADATCVAVSYFPDWGQNCYLFNECDEQENATENGETFIKKLVSAPYSISAPAAAAASLAEAARAESSKVSSWAEESTMVPIVAAGVATVLLLGLAKWVQLRSSMGSEVGILGGVASGIAAEDVVAQRSIPTDLLGFKVGGEERGLVPGSVQAYL